MRTSAPSAKRGALALALGAAALLLPATHGADASTRDRCSAVERRATCERVSQILYEALTEIRELSSQPTRDPEAVLDAVYLTALSAQENGTIYAEAGADGCDEAR